MRCGWCVLVHLLAVARSASASGLTALPPDIAKQASSAAENYAWAATNERMGPKGDVAHNQLAAADAIAAMTDLGKGLLTNAIITDFKWLAYNAGWCAANRRNGVTVGNQALLVYANLNEAAMNQHYDSLLSTGLFDESLLSNLKWMAWRASWYAANTRDTHFPEDAKTDKTYFDHYSKIIQGEVLLLSVDFDDKASKVMGQSPDIVGDQILDNSAAGITESMTFAYTYTQGHTDSWSNTVGFTVGIAEKITAGFIFASEETTVSYGASFSHSWSGGSSSGTTKTYTYPLAVPAHKIYQAKATVHSTTMDVPYTLKMSIGDYKWTSSGTWHGVAVSISTYKVTDITPKAAVQEMVLI